MIGRGLAAGRAPWGNMYEFTTMALVFVAAAVPADGLEGGPELAQAAQQFGLFL